MASSLKMTYKRILFRKTTYLLLLLFLIVLSLDSFLFLDWVAVTADGYQFPHAIEVFVLKHDGLVSILPVFLPFFIIGIMGDYLFNDKKSGMAALSSIRSSRYMYLKKALLDSSMVIGSLTAFIYSIILVVFLAIYPSASAYTGDALAQDPHVSPLIHALLLILMNAIIAVGMNLTAQAVGLLTSKKSSLYMVLFLVIFIIPYTLYYGIGPHILPLSNYMPFIVMTETLALPFGIFMILAYWLAYIGVHLIGIAVIYQIQMKHL